MQPFRVHKGKVAPLHRANIDTDQIIPKQFLKRVEKSGFGEFLFYDWRRSSDGTPDLSFPLNQPRYAGASVLVAGKNLGCGSSREHAVWALEDSGFRRAQSKRSKLSSPKPQWGDGCPRPFSEHCGETSATPSSIEFSVWHSSATLHRRSGRNARRFELRRVLLRVLKE